MDSILEKICEEYKQGGISLTQLSKKYSIGRCKITTFIKKQGVIIENKQNEVKFNQFIFDDIDTEEKAYWLGFIFADGCIRDSGEFEISLNAKDKGHLYKFNKFAGHIKDNVKVSIAHCGGVEFERCRWQVKNSHLRDSLIAKGCIPRKSLVLKFPDIKIFKSEDLIKHFIRGYFDGDGSLSYHKYLKSVSPNLSIIGTKEFLDEILKHLKITSPLILKDKRHKNNTFTYQANKEDTIKIINFLYKDATIYLDRKFKRYEFFKNGSRSLEEFSELLAGENGESLR
jgi:hypothetical protein